MGQSDQPIQEPRQEFSPECAEESAHAMDPDRGGIELSGNKQAEIMTAAVQLFQLQGYHATSMQDIADAVGLQKGSLYHYIAGKEELLLAIMHDAISQYNSRLAAVRSMDLPVRQKVELAVRNHLQGICEQLGTLTILLREDYALNAEQQQILDLESDRYNQMFEGLLAEGIQLGQIRPLNVKLVTRAVLGACNWAYRWYRPQGSNSPAELADLFVDLIMNGMAERLESGQNEITKE